MSSVLALGTLLLMLGAGGLAFGLYALLRGGRDGNGPSGDRGGLGPIPERGIHLVAGLRMTLFGLLGLGAGAYVIWTYL
ncbi:MAG: hypothetical protein H0V53_11110 [Rubrobacter sp.]|nr:hypothetical protein [Rubrobacter sp.]